VILTPLVQDRKEAVCEKRILDVGIAEILQVFPKVLQIRSFPGLDAQQPTQMAIVSLKPPG
jgi:hypothetical protein